jgi:hypothetical protein
MAGKGVKFDDHRCILLGVGGIRLAAPTVEINFNWTPRSRLAAWATYVLDRPVHRHHMHMVSLSLSQAGGSASPKPHDLPSDYHLALCRSYYTRVNTLFFCYASCSSLSNRVKLIKDSSTTDSYCNHLPLLISERSLLVTANDRAIADRTRHARLRPGRGHTRLFEPPPIPRRPASR